MDKEKILPGFSELLQRVKTAPGNIAEKTELVGNFKKIIEKVKIDDKCRLIKEDMAEDIENLENMAIELTIQYHPDLHESMVAIIEDIEMELENLKQRIN